MQAVGQAPTDPLNAPVSRWIALPGRSLRFLFDLFQAETDRWFLWSPILLACGIGLYFSLSFEPSLMVAIAVFAIFAALLWLLRHQGILAVLTLAVFLISLGFAAASFRVWRVAQPVLDREMAGDLVARIIDVERTESGGLSLLLAPQSFARLKPQALPGHVRITLRQKAPELPVGALISLRARLMPPPEPVEPGGFDYARQIWFEGIGAVGFAYTVPMLREAAPAGFVNALGQLRDAITTRIQTSIPGPAGAVAAALITGEQRAIPDETANDLRNAGLAHVLSISGFHMVLFGGSLFWILRALMALAPGLALRTPIKKWAAFFAIFGATFYLLISGMGIATQRAWIMIVLMFVAILLDRPALSLRNVALAALIVLLWQPESLLGASFQMSFAAVVALIAFYESDAAHRLNGWVNSAQGFWRYLLMPLAYAAGIATTSLVAGSATAPLAAWHFNRIALIYGLAGNMAALPIVATLVMPAALFALLLMPIGLDGPALWVMGQGVELMLQVAHYVSGWQGANDLVPSVPLLPLLLVVAGGLWLSLWRRIWRVAGIVPILIGFALWSPSQRPDVLIDREGAVAVVRMADGYLAATTRRASYAVKQWLQHEGDLRTPGEAGTSKTMRCDRHGCVYVEPGRRRIAFPADTASVFEDCELADIIVARVPVRPAMRQGCRAGLILDRFDLWRGGATSLTFMPDGSLKVQTSQDIRGERPWVQQRARNNFRKPDQ